MNEWIEEHRVGVEASAVGLAGSTIVFAAPAWTWDVATAHPLGFGLALCGGALAWVVRWEVREQAIQRWMDDHLLRWFVPASEHSWDGWWEWAPRAVTAPRVSAVNEHEEWLAGADVAEASAVRTMPRPAVRPIPIRNPGRSVSVWAHSVPTLNEEAQDAAA